MVWYLILQAFEAGFNKTPHGYAASFQRFDLLLKDPGAVLAATGHQWLRFMFWRGAISVMRRRWRRLGARRDPHIDGRRGGRAPTMGGGGLAGRAVSNADGARLVSGGRCRWTYLAVPLVVWIVLFLAHRGGAGRHGEHFGGRGGRLERACLPATVQARQGHASPRQQFGPGHQHHAAAALGADQPARGDRFPRPNTTEDGLPGGADDHRRRGFSPGTAAVRHAWCG